MKKEKLNRALNSVGKQVFVKYFATFRKCAEVGGNAACMAKLAKDNVGDSPRAQQTRCSNAKAIFDAGKECAALKMCAEATRIPTAARNRAQKLRDTYC